MAQRGDAFCHDHRQRPRLFDLAQQVFGGHAGIATVGGIDGRHHELLDFGAHVDRFELVYWFAILLAVNLQTSFLTPPFGFALFYLKGIAPREIKIQSIYKGIIPFVLLQLCGLILVIWKPGVALWLMGSVYGD